MAASVNAGTVRSQPNDLQGALQDVRTGAKACLRMAMKTDRATTCALIRHVMAVTGTSQKALAANAEISESVASDALNPNGQRNFAAEWIFDQEDAFLLALVEAVMRARGLTPESKRQAIAEDIGRLVTRLMEYAA